MERKELVVSDRDRRRPAWPGWLSDLLVCCLVTLLAYPFAPFAQFVPPEPVTAVCVALAVCVLPFRRRWSVQVLALLVVLYAVAAMYGVTSAALGVAVNFALFTVVTRFPRRTALSLAGATLGAMVGASLLVTGSLISPPVMYTVAFIVIFASVGDATRSRREFVRSVVEEAARAERSREAEVRRRISEERLRIARDLHDAVAHQIAVISLTAGAASLDVDNADFVEGSLFTIREAARTVLGEISDVLKVLRANEVPGSATPSIGVAALPALIDSFRRDGLHVEVEIRGNVERVAGTPSVSAYRIVQEALANAHKHGADARAIVLMAIDDEEIRILVTNPVVDNRQRRPASSGTGLGLVGLKERVSVVDGTVQVGLSPDGWAVDARLPLQRNPRE
jgi:signal transduction histidine kinase